MGRRWKRRAGGHPTVPSADTIKQRLEMDAFQEMLDQMYVPPRPPGVEATPADVYRRLNERLERGKQ